MTFHFGVILGLAAVFRVAYAGAVTVPLFWLYISLDVRREGMKYFVREL